MVLISRFKIRTHSVNHGTATSSMGLHSDTSWQAASKQVTLFGWTVHLSLASGTILPFFCLGLKMKLEDANEKAEADLGYRGEPNTVRHPHVFISKSDIKAKKMSRGRHETINRRMKQFNCLSQTFRHHVNNHQDVFQAVAVITQISFDCGEKPWQCTY